MSTFSKRNYRLFYVHWPVNTMAVNATLNKIAIMALFFCSPLSPLAQTILLIWHVKSRSITSCKSAAHYFRCGLCSVPNYSVNWAENINKSINCRLSQLLVCSAHLDFTLATKKSQAPLDEHGNNYLGLWFLNFKTGNAQEAEMHSEFLLLFNILGSVCAVTTGSHQCVVEFQCSQFYEICFRLQ